jgi:NADH-quinone oxidoreductase subunit M
MNLSAGTGSLLLSLTWIIPLLSAGVLMALPAGNAGGIRRFSLGVNALVLALVAFLSLAFALHPPAASEEATRTALAFAAKIPWFPAPGIHYHIGVDAISMSMMFLAAIIVFCGTLASWSIEDKAKEFFVLFQLLAAGVFGSFISFDLFTFFVFNELTLIPTYLLIGLFGSGRKEYAAMKLNLMLMGGSALILVGILGIYFQSGIRSFDILDLSGIRFDRDFQMWAFPALFLGFAILGNMFPFHIWSPDGHASAPTAISMLLAGVHMKLGSYGCLRIAMYLLPEGALSWMDVFLVLAAAGTAWGAIVAAKQKDLKYLNAYSSVSHCGLVFVGLAVLSAAGLRGAVLQMLAHGFITAAIFCLIGMIYARTHTRHIPAMGGLMGAMPFLSVSFVIAGFAALGLPGLAGFVAELNIFLGAFMPERPLVRVCAAVAVLSIVVTAVYVLRAANAILHGPARAGNSAYADATLVERVPVVLLLLCILAMGLYPGPLIALLDGALQPILNNLAR